jgi:AcrR family transcriptional regulator
MCRIDRMQPVELDQPRRRAAAMPADQRRSMIIDATLPLLKAQGEMVKTHDIAEAAGVAEGTIFRVFATKEELIEAVLDRVLDPAPIERAIAALDPSGGLEATVIEVVKLVQRRVNEVWQLISSVGPRHHRPKGRPYFDSPALTKLLKRFRGELSVDPERAAGMLRSIAFAMTHPMMTSEPAEPERIAHVFLYGVMKNRC